MNWDEHWHIVAYIYRQLGAEVKASDDALLQAAMGIYHEILRDKRMNARVEFKPASELMATEAQKKLLQQLGVKDVDRYTKEEASKLIDRLKRK